MPAKLSVGGECDIAGGEALKEKCMELKLGLNTLAAVTSFAFLAAIVLGMF